MFYYFLIIGKMSFSDGGKNKREREKKARKQQLTNRGKYCI